MLTSTIKRNAFRVLATLAFAAAPAFASLITVNNYNFEMPPAGGFPITCSGPCSYSVAAIPDWSGTAVTPRGEAQYGIGTRFSYYTDPTVPNTIAFSNGDTIYQTVGATVGTGTLYTLMVDIGQRADSGSFGGSADLLIGPTAGNGETSHFVTATGSNPASGGWSTFTAMYTGTAADAGATITIELQTIGVIGNVTHQGNFDNVRLEDAVPEPASFLLIGSALLALKAFRRRRPIA